jgi:hypothetical protein
VSLRAATVKTIEDVATKAIADATANPGIYVNDGFTGGLQAERFRDRNWLLYDGAVARLVADPAVENRSRSEVASALWDFTDDLLLHPAGLDDRKALRQRVQDFARDVTRPTRSYEVMFPVEGLRLPDGEITAGRARFLHLTEEHAGEWGLAPDRPFEKRLVDQTVGIVWVDAGSEERAREIAADELDTSLNVLRLGLALAPIGLVFDDFYLQRRSPYFAVREVGGPARVGFNRGFERADLDLRESDLGKQFGAALVAGAAGFSGEVRRLFDGSLPKSIAASLLRGLEWIASSLTREHMDDKIVDLCTAMECMLAVKSDGRKGEAIALRYTLLVGLRSGHYEYPHAPLPIYEVRSTIIHGSDRRVATSREYEAMRRVAVNTLRLALELVQRETDITSVGKLITRLETEENIERAMIVFGDSMFKPDQAVEAYADDRLAKLRAAASAENSAPNPAP